MIRSPLEFGDSYVGEPEPPRRWRRPVEEVIARVLVFVAIFLAVTFLSLGCGGASGEIAKGMLIRDAIVIAWNVGLIVAFVVVSFVCIVVKDGIDRRRRRKERRP